MITWLQQGLPRFLHPKGTLFFVVNNYINLSFLFKPLSYLFTFTWAHDSAFSKQIINYYMCMCAKLLQLCQLFVTLWAIAHQTPLFLGFSRQEYWSGLPCPPSGHLPDPGIKSTSLMSPSLAGRGLYLQCHLESSLKF